MVRTKCNVRRQRYKWAETRLPGELVGYTSAGMREVEVKSGPL